MTAAAHQPSSDGRGGSSPKKGDVVRYAGKQWNVTGVSFGRRGMRLVLECAEGCTALARPIELTLVGAQLELIPEEPT